MEAKKYLNLRKKIAYGSGDMASNFCYSFVSAFTMIYLTDTVGMNAGIIGMLIMLSRVFDGVSDVFAGNIIDKTHHRLGKARSWMLWTIIPVEMCIRDRYYSRYMLHMRMEAAKLYVPIIR